MTAKRGRPKGMPAHKRRAIESAIIETFVTYVDPTTKAHRRGAAYPSGWEHGDYENVNAVARHVVKAFAEIDIKVGARTVKAVWYARPLPVDLRCRDSPGLIRHAADMLNFEGPDSDRDRLINAIFAWCAKETRAGRSYPHRAHELAKAYRVENKRMQKIAGS